MNLKAKVGLDTTGFDAGLKRMKAKAGTFMAQQARGMGGAAMGGISRGGLMGGLMGIPIVGGIMRKLVTGPMDEGARIRDEAAKMGVAVETFQHLDYAARQSGGSIEDMGKAFKALAVRQLDAKQGNKQYLEAFQRYGITLDELQSKNPEQLFARIAEQVERGVNKANELADVQRLLGRSGTELLPTMQAGLGGAVAESMRIGAPMTREQVRSYAAASDELTRLNQKLSAAGYRGVDVAAEGLAEFSIRTARGLPGANYGEARQQRMERILAEKQDAQLDALNAIKANTAPLNRP